MTYQLSESDQRVRNIADRYRRDPTYMLQILREIQELHGWIAPSAVGVLESALHTPRTKIIAVAGFYSFLHTEPCGKYRVLFSDNITDRMLGNMDLLQRMTAKLGVARDRISGKVILDKEVKGHTFVHVGNDLASAESEAMPLLAEDLALNIAELLTEGAWLFF